MQNSDVSRRAFMKLAAGTGAALAMPSMGNAAVSPREKMIGIQIGAISFVEEQLKLLGFSGFMRLLN